MIRLLLVDDQELFRQGLASLLELEADIDVLGQAKDGCEAIRLTQSLQPDVILMDVRMPICDGVEATKQIHASFPWIRILVLTTFDQDEYIWRSLQAGALGYLLKSTPAQQLADAVRMLHHGHFQLGPTIAPKVVAHLRPPQQPQAKKILERLSPRELEVLTLVQKGNSNREISQLLHLTEGTVKNYVSQLLGHLGVRDRTQAALWANQHLPGD